MGRLILIGGCVVDQVEVICLYILYPRIMFEIHICIKDIPMKINHDSYSCFQSIKSLIMLLTLHWENYISTSFHIEWDMFVVTVFRSISELNGIPFGSENRQFFKLNPNWFRKSKGKLPPRSYLIQFERKWKYSFLSRRDVQMYRTE